MSRDTVRQRVVAGPDQLQAIAGFLDDLSRNSESKEERQRYQAVAEHFRVVADSCHKRGGKSQVSPGKVAG